MTLLGIKQEMTQYFDADGRAVAVTVVDVSNNVVIGKKTVETDGYQSIILGLGTKKNYSKAEEKKYAKLGFVPKHVVEARNLPLDDDKISKPLEIDGIENKTVNVTGISKGKGFQGVVKRWGFHGGPKTHGQSDRHRAPGSIGSGTTPGRVYKGKKMAGRMGGVRKTIENLQVVKYLKEENLVLIKGAIPGNKGGLVVIKIKE